MTAFDEMTVDGTECRGPYKQLQKWLQGLEAETLRRQSAEAEMLFRRIGITFAVYGEADAEERLIPFDLIPRILSADEWGRMQKGLTQRVKTLNMFLTDVYGPRECIKAGVVPADLVDQNAQYRPEMIGAQMPGDVWVNIAGIDIVRVNDDEFYVLEDNARTPSGVSYMLENREVMMRILPELFYEHTVEPVENYSDELLQALQSVAPAGVRNEPTCALLTPGPFNSAYYEHSFLADKLGIELVEGRDLFVRDAVVYMRTTLGPQRVDVIYRRIDDDFIDPLAFKPESVLGVPGLMTAYLAGNVTLANAVGTGISDDKAIYTYMPELTRFFLDEDPILKNVPTWRCREPEALSYVLDNLPDLVVKEVAGSGGYGMLVGPKASKDEIEIFRAKLKAKPDAFIAQPTLALSTCPTFVGEGVAPRHVDLRPFVLSGTNGVTIVPGGLSRVALKEGSLVVNSSQGGGTKDTWILAG
ncbi:MAG: circularly permuted type 2 ATP-grasp protein [Pseudomonadota bacterium]